MNHVITNWFANPGIVAFISMLLAILSLIVSVIAGWASWHTSRRMVKIEEIRDQDRLREMLKANLVAEMMTDSHEIRIINTGKAEAKNVTIQLEGDPFFPEGSKGNNVIKETIIPVIGPSAYIDLIIYRHDAMKPQFTVTITWVDGSEEAGLFKSTLNLF